MCRRVTAACLNCRRKKVKCSGEVDCRQCQEKGLVCEGPPSRKRAKNNRAASSAGEATFSINEQPEADGPREGHGSESSQQRLPPTLLKEDSGYGSHERVPQVTSSEQRLSPEDAENSSTASAQYSAQGRPSDTPTAASKSSNTAQHYVLSPLPPDFTSPFAFNNLVHHQGSSNDATSNTAAPTGESYGTQSNASMHQYHNDLTAPSNSHHVSQHSSHHISRPALTNMSAESMDWSRRGSADWWSSAAGHAQASAELITAAEALEGQAQILRRQAARRQSGDWAGGRSGPISHSSQYVGMGRSSMQDTYYDSNLSHSEEFDASAFFHPDGTLRSGLTPGANQFTSSWNLDGELHALQQSGSPDQSQMETTDATSGSQNPEAPGSHGWRNEHCSARQ